MVRGAEPERRVPGNHLEGVAAVSADDVWAVGTRSKLIDGVFVPVPLILHWDGSAWSVVPALGRGTPRNGVLGGVLAVGSDDVWSAGATQSTRCSASTSARDTIEHWDGAAARWSPAPKCRRRWLVPSAGWPPWTPRRVGGGDVDGRGHRSGHPGRALGRICVVDRREPEQGGSQGRGPRRTRSGTSSPCHVRVPGRWVRRKARPSSVTGTGPVWSPGAALLPGSSPDSTPPTPSDRGGCSRSAPSSRMRRSSSVRSPCGGTETGGGGSPVRPFLRLRHPAGGPGGHRRTPHCRGDIHQRGRQAYAHRASVPGGLKPSPQRQPRDSFMTLSASRSVRTDSYLVLDATGHRAGRAPNLRFRDAEPPKRFGPVVHRSWPSDRTIR